MITIFTPIYNRAGVIGNLYRSLLKQTSYDFEWLIVDDGSKDNVGEVAEGWIQEGKAPFAIRFYRQDHGGKHRAINKGVGLAAGDAFFIVDSDDSLTPDAVETVGGWWKEIGGDRAYAGVSGLRQDVGGGVIGGRPPFGGYVDATNLEREKYGLSRDKAEIYRTSVLRANPFPEFMGETFLPEGVVWDKIAYEGLKIRWYNRVIYLCEYRADGLTRQGWELYARNPVGWGYFLQQKCSFYPLEETRRRESYFEYYILLKDVLSEGQIGDYLKVGEEELRGFRELHRQRVEKTVSAIGRNIALYGAGARGRKIWKFYRGTEVEIVYVLDRRKADLPCRQVDLEGEYPKVDAIIVTPQAGQEEIIAFLEGRTADRLVGYDAWKSCLGLGGSF